MVLSTQFRSYHAFRVLFIVLIYTCDEAYNIFGSFSIVECVKSLLVLVEMTDMMFCIVQMKQTVSSAWHSFNPFTLYVQQK